MRLRWTRLLGDREWPGSRALIGDIVFGASDGLITTFVLVSSVTGADLGSSVAIVLGLANLLPDGISMGAGQYLARRSETQAAARADGKEVDRWVPAVHGTVMFAAFLILGAPPLLPYLVLDPSEAFSAAAVCAAAVLFTVGALRTTVTGARWVSSGLGCSSSNRLPAVSVSPSDGDHAVSSREVPSARVRGAGLAPPPRGRVGRSAG